MHTRILVVEDEETLRMALADALRAEGFEVLEAADGEHGLALALREGPEVVLLDLMLPKRDGFSVLRALREDRLAATVIILSARGEEWDRVQGFEYGADDYVVKPFSMRELLLRVRAALRRAEGRPPGVDGIADPRGRVRFGAPGAGAVEVDFAAYTLTRGRQRYGLSRMELELLRYFLAHEGRTLDRLRLLSDVWGPDEEPGTRTIDHHVLKLRKKLERDPERPRHLLTVHGVGYRFSRAGEEPA
jgi:DNA-binding response OmpR family regulator